MHSGAPSVVSKESGFTLVEVLIAGFVVTVGLMTLAYGYGQGMVSVLTAQQDTIAPQKCRETLESVMTALNTQNLDFTNNLCNASQGPQCIFMDGFTPLYNPGADGLFGTADDVASGIQSIVMPGPDGVLGTADDVTVSLNNYGRQILITPRAPP